MDDKSYFDYEDRYNDYDNPLVKFKFRHGIRPFRYVYCRHHSFLIWKKPEDNLFNHRLLCFYVKNPLSSADIQLIMEKNIEIMIFDDKFNTSIDNLPSHIKYIIFTEDSKFNKNIDHLPANLEYLALGESFNQSVDNLPDNLFSLIIGDYFNKSVDNLPSNLKYLQIGQLIIQDFHNSKFNQSINNLPDSLEVLDIYTNKLDYPIVKLPKMLKTAFLPNENKKEITEILKNKDNNMNHAHSVEIDYFTGYY
jgi:hypothetical protein